MTNKQNRYLGWRDVDKTRDPQHYVKDLDSYRSTNPAQEMLPLTYQMLHPQPGHKILDVGCGTGDDVRALAAEVGNSGHVVGVDRSAVMVAEAKNRTRDTQLPVTFFVGDAHMLGFADNTFDACRAVTVYDHLENPHQAIKEMMRITRPQARILLAEIDWGAVVIDHPDRQLTRTILNYHCDVHLKNGWIGRQLPNLLAHFGLTNIAIKSGSFILREYDMANRFLGFGKAVNDAQEDNVITPEQGENWLNTLRALNNDGRFFAAMIGFIVSGQKSDLITP